MPHDWPREIDFAHAWRGKSINVYNRTLHYLCLFGMREDWREDWGARGKINSDWVRVWGSWPRGIGELIPNPHFRLIFTSIFLGFTPPSYAFINATVRILMNVHKSFFCCFKGTSLVGEIGLSTFLFYWVIWLLRDPWQSFGPLLWYSLKI